MRKTTIAIALVATALFTPAQADTKGGTTMSADTSAVLAVIEGMTAAFQRGDIDEVMSSYEDQATIVFEPENPVSDNATVREMFRQLAGISPRFEYAGHEVFLAGDIAVHFAPWNMKGKAPDGTEFEQSGLSVAVLRRQSDCRWLMVIDNPHGQRLLNR